MRTSNLAESRPKETLEQVRTSRCSAYATNFDISSARRTQKALKAIQQNIEAVLSGNPTPEVRLDGVDDSESDGCARQPHRMSDLVLIRLELTESTAGRVCCVIRLRSSRTRRRSASIRVRAQPRAQLVCPSYALLLCAFSASILILKHPAVPPVPRAEENLALDPVDCGILSYDDLCRLHTLSFTHLYPFLWILLPELHTVEYLRLRSPFLTTSLAFVASTFDPGSALLTPALGRHALALAVRVFEKDLKTLEIVQAYFLLS